MRDKALKKKLQQLHIPQYDEYKLEKVIVEAKKIDLFSGNQRMTNTEFFLNQLGFISKKVWSLKAFFSISILYLILAKDVYSNNWVWTLIATTGPILCLFNAKEICNVFQSGMFEIQMATKHSFSKVLMIRLIVFGIFDLLFLICSTIILYSTTWGICLSSIIIILKISGVELFATCYFAIWLVFGLIAVSGIGVEIKQLLKKTGGNLNEISNGTFI